MKKVNFKKMFWLNIAALSLVLACVFHANAASQSVSLSSDQNHVWSFSVSAGKNPSSAFYTGSVKSTSKHNVAFGLYCNNQANGTFSYCGRTSRHVVGPGKTCTSTTFNTDKYYKVKLVAGNDLVNDLQKGCIASATLYVN